MLTAPKITKETILELSEPVWNVERNRYVWTKTSECEADEENMQEYKAAFLNEQAHLDTLTPEFITAQKVAAQEEVDWVEAGEATK